MKVYHLIPKSSFRTELRSDTLWGLLISALSYLHPKEYIDSIVNQFVSGRPPFLISSCFPYKNENGKRIYYLPLPLSGHGLENLIGDYNAKKELKKVKFVKIEFFNDLINGVNQDLLIKHLQHEQKVDFLKSETNVRIKINRLTNGTQDECGEGQLFNSIENYFINGGYYFFVEGDFSIIEPALRLLSHNGFGGYVTKGKGYFDVEDGEVNLTAPQEANAWLTLSLYHPKREELSFYQSNSSNLWYDVVRRQGKVANQFRKDANWIKKPILSFTEGSVFPLVNNDYIGEMTETYQTTDWKIYNYGYAFKIPYKL